LPWKPKHTLIPILILPGVPVYVAKRLSFDCRVIAVALLKTDCVAIPRDRVDSDFVDAVIWASMSTPRRPGSSKRGSKKGMIKYLGRLDYVRPAIAASSV
jgi:hypothetical protein